MVGGQVEHDGQAALHVGRADTPQRVAVERWAQRCGSVEPCRDARPAPGAAPGRPSSAPPRCRPGGSVSSQAQPRSRSSTRSARALSSWLSEGIAINSAVAANRSVTALTSRAQVLAPCSRSTSFSCALSCRSPSVSRLMTSTHGMKNSPPGYSRRRLARMATHHGGHHAAADLLAGLGVDDRDRRDRGNSPRRAPTPARPARPAGHHAAAADEARRPPRRRGRRWGARARRRCPRRRTGGPGPRSGRTTPPWPRCRPWCPPPPRRRCSRSEGIRTTPRARNEPQRAEAPGTTRTPAAAKSCLSGSLSAYSNGPCSMVSMPAEREQHEDRLLQPLVDDHLIGGGIRPRPPGPGPSRAARSPPPRSAPRRCPSGTARPCAPTTLRCSLGDLPYDLP